LFTGKVKYSTVIIEFTNRSLLVIAVFTTESLGLAFWGFNYKNYKNNKIKGELMI